MCHVPFKLGTVDHRIHLETFLPEIFSSLSLVGESFHKEKDTRDFTTFCYGKWDKGLGLLTSRGI